MSIDGLAPVQQSFAVFEIVAHHELAVPLGGGRARAQMEHGGHRPQVLVGLNPGHEILPVQVVVDMQVGQVVHLLAVFQMVNHQNVGVSALVELLDQVAADEAGAAGDDHKCYGSACFKNKRKVLGV